MTLDGGEGRRYNDSFYFSGHQMMTVDKQEVNFFKTILLKDSKKSIFMKITNKIYYRECTPVAKLSTLVCELLKFTAIFQKGVWMIYDLRANIYPCPQPLMGPNGVKLPWQEIYRGIVLLIILVQMSFVQSK